MISMETDRFYLNVLKGLLIVFVVVGHFGQTIANNLPSSIDFIGQGIVLFIYLFHMPLFLFVSGYLSKNTEKRRQKAFEDLFIPYVVFQLFVGICILVLTKSGGVLQNIFVPQMGAWYLLTLFSFRIVLPETSRIRGVLILGVLLTVFACTMRDIGNEFALQKSLGFFVYFMAGYKIAELPRRKIRKVVARITLAILLLILIFISWKTDWYSLAFSVLSRGATVDVFTNWYFGPLVYFITFILTLAVMLLVMNAIPERCTWLEKQGTDTMPMYLSHLILFMAVGYLINKNNWIITVGVSGAFIIVSLFLFSTNWYRKIFNGVMGSIKKMLFRED